MTSSFPTILQRYPVATFVMFAYGWTWFCWWSVVASSRGRLSLPISDSALATIGQFGPFAAAVIVTTATRGLAGLHDFAGRFLRWRAHPVWLLVALFFLPATMLAAIYWHAFFGGTIGSLKFSGDWSTIPLHFVYLLVIGGPLGEEPGWRGFALPWLQERNGPTVGSVWLGMLHAGWHWPLWWMHRPPCPFWMYVAGVVLVTFLFTWLFNHTGGSLLYALLFHTSLSIASVRLPEVPAYHLWIVVLIPVVLAVFAFDPRLGLRASDTANLAASGRKQIE
jgi:membrane protease YdiL (CAAX protease family)